MIKILKNIEELEAIKDDCNRLADNFVMPLLRFEWLINCARSISSNEELFVLVLIEEGIVKAIAPLVLTKNNHTEKLEMLGSSLHGEPCGFLYEDETSLHDLLESIAKMKKIISFNGIREYSLERMKIEQLCAQNKNLVLMSSKNVPYLPVSGEWKNFEQGISKSRRSSLKRLLRLAEEMGKVSVEIVSPTAEDVDKYLDEIFEVEASGWKNRIGSAMMTNKKLGNFFCRYSHDAADLKILRFCFLRIDGTAAAVQIGIEYANRFWFLKIGFNERFARCSPGIILMNELISYAFHKKIDAIEFLGSNEEWLHIWTNQFHGIINYRIYNSFPSCIFNLSRTYPQRLFNKFHLISAKRENRMKGVSNV